MITAEEFVFELNQDESKNFKLATVVGLFENGTAKIKFDGEDVESEKQYAYLDSYIPEDGDRVLLGILNSTYVILGKVNYNVSPSAEEEIDRYLFDLKQVIMQKGLSVTGNTALETVSIENATITEKLIAEIAEIKNLILTGALSVTEVNASIKVDTPTVTTNTLTCSGTASTGNFSHKGSFLSFFNKSTMASKTSVSTVPTSADLSAVISKLNQLINALTSYNLV